MRVMVKGGVWKNTEDEILKAAVMKYGKNQWARISSLLVRKSAKQCKARWYEWLDPSIKKTEWSREEEEKLLHMAKIMPNQWRTIAPMVGRTATQCLEHYERLLDRAQGKEGLEDENDPRKLRPGEIDPNPETKPARPDPVDMDEDEKEMLTEARARLANTKGKKAKRKAREKQLDEARRLASLSKRREMKAAGIEVGMLKRKIKGIDYAREVPFERRPAAGFFDTSEEDQALREEKDKPFRGTGLAAVDGVRKSDEEARKRRDDERRQREKMKTNLPEAIAQMNKMSDPEHVRKRSKLALPEPQLTDRDLEEISKMEGAADRREQAGLLEDAGDKKRATNALLTRYDAGSTPAAARGLSLATPLRTPAAVTATPTQRGPARTPARPDNIMMEAQNLIAMTNTKTPLAGGDNPILNPTELSAPRPAGSRAGPGQTPNPLLQATPRSTRGGAEGARPGSVLRSILAGTPVRDELKLNDERLAAAEESAAEERHKRQMLQRQVQSGLLGLPAPRNEYQVVVPAVADADEDAAPEELAPDTADLQAKEEARKKAAAQALFNQRSSALRRSLPRPVRTDAAHAPPAANLSAELKQAELLVRAETHDILLHDQLHFPVPGTKEIAAPAQPFDVFSEAELKEAADLVKEEMKALPLPPLEAVHSAFNQLSQSLLFLPDLAEPIDLADPKLDKKAAVAALSKEYDRVKNRVLEEGKRATKTQQKVAVLHGGYESVNEKTRREILDLSMQLSQLATEVSCFHHLRSAEAAAIPYRTSALNEEVAVLVEREAQLQERYAGLLEEKEKLEAAAVQT